MEKADARFLNPIIQNYLRQKAIRLREQETPRMNQEACASS